MLAVLVQKHLCLKRKIPELESVWFMQSLKFAVCCDSFFFRSVAAPDLEDDSTCTRVNCVNKPCHVADIDDFFFRWLLHGSTSSLCGRSPFCQVRNGKRCRCNIGYKQSNESNGAKIKKTPAKPRCSLSKSARGRGNVPRTINQGLEGESREHACWPSERKAPLVLRDG